MIDLGILYEILRQVAMRGDVISYSDLSSLYFDRTGEQHHHHGTWDAPLGELNSLTHAAKLPAISPVVTYRVNEDDPDSQFVPPGDAFWGTPGVIARPATAEQREFAWYDLLKRAHQTRWPNSLSGEVNQEPEKISRQISKEEAIAALQEFAQQYGKETEVGKTTENARGQFEGLINVAWENNHPVSAWIDSSSSSSGFGLSMRNLIISFGRKSGNNEGVRVTQIPIHPAR